MNITLDHAMNIISTSMKREIAAIKNNELENRSTSTKSNLRSKILKKATTINCFFTSIKS
jgi:hypothetical protein